MDETMTRTWTPESEQPSPGPVVDYHAVKAWFQQCRDDAAAVEAQKQKIQRIREVAEKCTQSLNGMPGGGGSGDKVGDAVARMDAEERELKQMEQRLALLKMNATCRAYTGAVDPETIRQGDCIRMFYIENRHQPAIVEALGLCENSEVSKIIRRGCERLALLWDTLE